MHSGLRGVPEVEKLSAKRRDGTLGRVAVSAFGEVDGEAGFDVPSSVGANQFDGDRGARVIE